jgi:O-antigen/teichoic acid export membrane protein
MSEEYERVAGDRSEETDSDLREKVATEGALAFGAGILDKGVGFVFQLLLARFLGPGGYGLYVLGWTVVHYVQPFVMLGVRDGLVRFIPDYLAGDDHRHIRGTLYWSLGISLSLAGLATVGIYGFADFLARDVFGEQALASVLRVFALSIPLYALMYVTTATAVGFQQVRYQQAVLNVLFPLLKLSVVGVLFLAGYRLLGAVAGVVLALLVAATVGVGALPRIAGDVDVVGPAEVDLARLLRYSVPLFLVGFTELAISQTDRLVLGALATSGQVGRYNAAYILSQQTLIFFTAMMTIFNPVVADLYSKGDRESLQDVYESVTRWILVVSLPVVVFGSVFARELLAVFGQGFRGGSVLLPVLLFAQLIFVSAGPAREVLVMSDNQNVVLVDTTLLLSLNVGLNLLLVPEYGASGAAAATVATIGLVQALQVYQAARYVSVFPFDRAYLRVVALGIPFVSAGYGAWYLAVPLWTRVALAVGGGTLYAVLAWKYAITDADVRLVRNTVGV